jgi:hypothetical protein
MMTGEDLAARQHHTNPIVNVERSTTMSQKGPKAYSVEVTQDAAPWLKDALDRISALTALADGWDSYGGRAVDATIVMDTVKFLMKVSYPSIPRPSIVPLATGGLQVEWHRGGVDLEVAFCDEDPGALVSDRESGDVREMPTSEAATEVTRLLKRLRDA